MASIRASVCIAAFALVGCDRTPSRPHDPVAPVVVPPAVEDPTPARDAPPRWTDRVEPTACMVDHVASMALMPGTADLVFGIDAMSVVGTRTYAEHRQTIETGDLRTVIEVAQGCELGPTTWRGVTFGAHMGGNDNVIVLRADGIGRAERLECMRVALERKDGKSPWTAEGSSPITLAFTDGRVGMALDPCTLVVTTAGWAAPTRDRLLGKGAALGDGPLATPLARTDPRKQAWFAGTLSSQLFLGAPFAGAKDVAGHLDIAGGLALALSITFGDPAEAAKRAAELQQQFDALKSTAVGMGVPQEVADSVRIVPVGAQVMVQLAATDAQLRSMRAKTTPAMP